LNIGPVIFPLFAAAHFLIGVAALSAFTDAPAAAVCLALVEWVTCYDNTIVALGNRLGVGRVAERLNRTRFLLHAVCISLLLPVYAGIGRLAGVVAFDSSVFDWTIGVLAIVIAAIGYFVGYRKVTRIMPVNDHGCLRYAQAVGPEGRLADYDYSPEDLAARGLPPIASIATVIIGLGLSIWVGMAAAVWVPAIVTMLMLLAGSFPARTWRAVATSCLEIVFSAGLMYSLLMV
jgi:hypothetical protein